MNLDSIPLFSMLKSRLGYENQREKLIGQNVANADTPGYAPQDLKAFAVPESMGGSGGGLAMLQPTATAPGHLTSQPAASGQSGWKVITVSDSESSLDGNQVVLEDQMAKMSDARSDFQSAIQFYEKSLSMLRLAARRPGSSS